MIGHRLATIEPGPLDSVTLVCQCGWTVTLPDHYDPRRRHRIHVAEMRSEQGDLLQLPPRRVVLDVRSPLVDALLGGAG